MNTYSQAKINGNAMPFIMGCARPSPIEAMEDEEKVIYDPMTQSTVLNMRVVGTRSLRSSLTNKKTALGGHKLVTDKKNEIDDSKSVK